MMAETGAERFWRHVTVAPIARLIVMGDLAIAAFLTVAVDFDMNVFLVVSAPAGAAIVWICFTACRAQYRRGRMRQLLDAALTAHGEVPGDVTLDRFPDIPVCISKKWIYCARQKEVDAQPLDQMAWAYGESFVARPWHQLVIWNRSASANVLPLQKRYIAPTLERVRQAAPWLPAGYNEAMKESWNADHREFIALVDTHRQSRKAFDVPWAGQGVARVVAHGRSNALQDFVDSKEERGLTKLMQRWSDGG